MKSFPTGRKHCSQCRCWRPLSDFGVVTGQDKLRSRCRTCERIAARFRLGIKRRGQPYGQQGRQATAGIPRTNGASKLAYDSPEYRRYQRELSRRKTPEQVEQRREYQRIHTATQRRQNGSPEKVLQLRPHVPQRNGETIWLPVEPFAEWLRERVPERGLHQWAQGVNLNGDHVGKILRGTNQSVHIDVVDRALTADGGTHLRELYPELYEEQAVAA